MSAGTAARAQPHPIRAAVVDLTTPTGGTDDAHIDLGTEPTNGNLHPDRAVRPSPQLRTRYRLPGNVQAAGNARWLLTAVLDGHPAEQRDTALLLVSELATNAVQHAGAAHLILSIDVTGTAITVAVTDTGPGAPELRHPDPDSPGGRGLLFVNTLATSWGWTTHRTGKTVWFQLETAPTEGRAAAGGGRHRQSLRPNSS